ncbi:MAG TPA: hypothetical protein VFL80_02980 [Thermoanaerobaculia bacterium]|nr:hypothetical protein [Thermoanaerobaculia bacterium]
MTRRTVVLLAFLTLATSAPAQSTTPDYSRDALLRLIVRAEREAEEKQIEIDAASIRFKGLGTRWKFVFLPLLAPLPNSVRRTSSTLPNPFVEAGAEIAYRPGTWRDMRDLPRDVERELRRIKQKERARIRVNVR